VITVYRAVKFTSEQITSKMEEFLYAMKRDQEGRQRQGLRTIWENRRIIAEVFICLTE
jgi:hypothetical protein